ncbi:hypothetical protein ACLBWX_04135 [Methylobacterium sp. M6A4_1b]
MRPRIWTVPVILNSLIVVSLLGALVAEEVWDGVAGALLSGILLYVFGKGLRRPSSPGLASGARSRARPSR